MSCVLHQKVLFIQTYIIFGVFLLSPVESMTYANHKPSSAILLPAVIFHSAFVLLVILLSVATCIGSQ